MIVAVKRMLLGGTHRQPEIDQGVQTAGAKALQVERDEPKTYLTQLRHQLLPMLGSQQHRQGIHRHFQPREVTAMIAHAHGTQAERAQILLGLIDHLQTLRCHFLAVRDATRQAGRRRFIPNWKLPIGGQRTHIGFRKATFDKRASNGMFSRRLHARAIVALVVEIRAVDEDIVAWELGLQLLQLSIEFRFAMVATIRSVAHIRCTSELVGLNDFVSNADQLCQGGGVLKFAASQTGAHAGHCQGVSAQSDVCGFRHDRAIDPPRECDGATYPPAHQIEQLLAQSRTAFGGRLNNCRGNRHQFGQQLAGPQRKYLRGCRAISSTAMPWECVRESPQSKSGHRNLGLCDRTGCRDERGGVRYTRGQSLNLGIHADYYRLPKKMHRSTDMAEEIARQSRRSLDCMVTICSRSDKLDCRVVCLTLTTQMPTIKGVATIRPQRLFCTYFFHRLSLRPIMSVIDSDAEVQLSGEAVIHAPLPPQRSTPPPLPPRPATITSDKITSDIATPPTNEEAALGPPEADVASLPRRWNLLAIPSWLVSLVVHLAMILLMAMFTIPLLINEPDAILVASVAEPYLLETTEAVAIMPPLMAEQHETTNLPASEMIESQNLTEIGTAALGDSASAMTDVDAVNISEVAELFGQDGAGMANVAGPGGTAEFFGVKAGGRKFVFIVDSSNSMRGRKFADAKRELEYAVKKLDPKQSFYVIFFDQNAERMFAAGGKEPEARPVPATGENIRRLEYWLPLIKNELRTNPYDAVKFAVEMLPDAIYILSDGQFTDKGQTERYLAANNMIDEPLEGRRPKVVIHTIGFYSREGEPTLQAIAKAYGGTYRFVPKP